MLKEQGSQAHYQGDKWGKVLLFLPLLIIVILITCYYYYWYYHLVITALILEGSVDISCL